MHILVSYSSHALKVVQVIGVTGAGKTTFVNTVTGENSLETNDDVNSGMYLSIPLARPFFFFLFSRTITFPSIRPHETRTKRLSHPGRRLRHLHHRRAVCNPHRHARFRRSPAHRSRHPQTPRQAPNGHLQFGYLPQRGSLPPAH